MSRTPDVTYDTIDQSPAKHAIRDRVQGADLGVTGPVQAEVGVHVSVVRESGGADIGDGLGEELVGDGLLLRWQRHTGLWLKVPTLGHVGT